MEKVGWKEREREKERKILSSRRKSVFWKDDIKNIIGKKNLIRLLCEFKLQKLEDTFSKHFSIPLDLCCRSRTERSSFHGIRNKVPS